MRDIIEEEGEFKYGMAPYKKKEYRRHEFDNGAVIEGEYNEVNQQDGRAIYIFKNGDIFEGWF